MADLRLALASCKDSRSTELDLNSISNDMPEDSLSYTNEKQQKETQQKITMFDKDRVCDVTEFLAREIISKANREMEELRAKNRQKIQVAREHQNTQQLLNPELSMKLSLQRFLQKRKTRITAAASPYIHRVD